MSGFDDIAERSEYTAKFGRQPERCSVSSPKPPPKSEDVPAKDSQIPRVQFGCRNFLLLIGIECPVARIGPCSHELSRQERQEPSRPSQPTQVLPLVALGFGDSIHTLHLLHHRGVLH
jgi:hypothetical protein